jgi:CheY-like chemotaxis protein
MHLTACRFGIGVALLAAMLSQAPGQDNRQPPKEDEPPKEDVPKKEKAKKGARKEEGPKKDDNYRQFFRQPESIDDFWRALSFEIEVGRPDLAAQHLQGLVNKKPTEAELLELEEEHGMTSILRLRGVRKWDDDPKVDKQAKDNVERLIQGATAALEKHLSNQDRIAKFVKNLASGEPEERTYALRELYRAGPRMIPAFIERLRDARGDERVNLLTALQKLGDDTVPPLLAALDIDDRALQTDLIDVFQKRADRRAVPYLWYLADSEPSPAEVRAKAREALASLRRTPVNLLPAGKAALTEEAERYYKHQAAFSDPQRVTVWRWDGKTLVPSTVPASRAEEFYGLRFARQALDLDSSYRPAQIVFLSLALEKATESLGLDQPLTKGPPAINELLASVSPELVTAVLDRALTERRTAVILGAARALGASAEVRAQRPTGREEPALVRALKYPDRRVQLVAADALLRIPGAPLSPARARIVEVLRRTAAADPVSKVLVADGNRDRAGLVADAVRKAGFEPVIAATGREALRLVRDAADIDVVLVDEGITDPQIQHFLAQMRADLDVGQVAIVITEAPAPGAKEAALERTRAGIHRQRLAQEDQARRSADFERADERLRQLAKQYPNVTVIAATTDANLLRGLFGDRIGDDMGRPFTDAEQNNSSAATADRLKRLLVEREDHADRALIWLGRLAKGEIAGYDVTPAADTLANALRSGSHSNAATNATIEAVGRLPGAKSQRALADFVADARRLAALRAVAATQLTRHIQQHGAMLPGGQVQALEALLRTGDLDPTLRANVAALVGTLHRDSKATGERLKGYALPPPPAPAPLPKAKEKEEEKDKD